MSPAVLTRSHVSHVGFLLRALLAGLCLVAAGALPQAARAQDVDGDGVPDARDVCNNTPPGIAVDDHGRPRGDLDLDCDTDMNDLAIFQSGFTGPLFSAFEICGDGIDNDLDGLTDCEDADDCPLGAPCAAGAYCTQFLTCGCPPGTDDCDNNPANGCEPLNTPQSCGLCNVPCDLPNAAESCATGVCVITSCSPGWCNLDGIDANGCEHHIDSNPPCTQSLLLGVVSGDEPGPTLMASGAREERWYRVVVREDDNSIVSLDNLGVRIALDSAPGADFDLYVYCEQCFGALVGSSTNPPGTSDVVFVGALDEMLSDDGFQILVEVRWSSGGCDLAQPWQLSVTGNQNAPTTCNR